MNINMTIKKLLAISASLLIPVIMSGQLYRISFGMGYQFNLTPGGEFNNTDGVSTISLIKNFKTWQSPAFRISYAFSKTSSIGLYYEIDRFKNWESASSGIYNNTKMKFSLAGPFYKYELPQIRSLGKLKAGLSLGAVYGTYNINLGLDIYDVDLIAGLTDFPYDEEGTVAGLVSDLSIGYPLSVNMKLYFNLGLKYIYMNSLLCTDKTTFSLSPEIGINFSILKNKTFYIY
jgi:hypothetical protein